MAKDIRADTNTGVKVGLARVSTYTQLKKGESLDAQKAKLKAFGCKKIFAEQYTGTAKHRPKLDELMDYVKHGDTVVCCRFDRIGRSFNAIESIVDRLMKKDVKLVTLDPPMQIDKTTAMGQMTYGMLSTFATVEHTMINNRMRAGKEYALKTRGKSALGGRPKRLNADEKTMRHYLSVYDTYNDLKHFKQRFPKDYAKKYSRPVYEETAQRSGYKSVTSVYNIVHTFNHLTAKQIQKLKRSIKY